VLLLHGGGGHGRLLLPFALPLHAAGVEVLAPDLPNFGLARREPIPPTFDRWVALVSALVDRYAAAGRRVVLYGLSIGGLTAYHVAAENPRVAGVVATMLADLRRQEVRDAAASSLLMSRVAQPLVALLPGLLDRMPLPAGRVGRLGAMIPDRAFVATLARDPRVGRVPMPAGFYRTLCERDPAVEPEAFRGPPALLVHPGADRWTPFALSLPLFEALAAPKRLVILEGAAHLPFAQPAFDEMQDAVLAFLGALGTVGARRAGLRGG